MTQPSFNKSNGNSANNGSVENPDKTAASNSQTSIDRRVTNPKSYSSSSESILPQQQKPQQWSLKSKVTAWAIALTMFPVVAVGISSYFSSQSITQQITLDQKASTAVEEALEKHRSFLLLETGAITQRSRCPQNHR
ncbi:hypothetical protein VB735_19205 [Halotia wernerae UHCC 0503]|nr:hypothetical protein [Halotia wernerae UHCC 0503]